MARGGYEDVVWSTVDGIGSAVQTTYQRIHELSDERGVSSRQGSREDAGQCFEDRRIFRAFRACMVQG